METYKFNYCGPITASASLRRACLYDSSFLHRRIVSLALLHVEALNIMVAIKHKRKQNKPTSTGIRVKLNRTTRLVRKTFANKELLMAEHCSSQPVQCAHLIYKLCKTFAEFFEQLQLKHPAIVCSLERRCETIAVKMPRKMESEENRRSFRHVVRKLSRLAQSDIGRRKLGVLERLSLSVVLPRGIRQIVNFVILNPPSYLEQALKF